MKRPKTIHVDDLIRIASEDGGNISNTVLLDVATIDIQYLDDVHYEKLTIEIDIPSFMAMMDYMTIDEMLTLQYPPTGSAMARLDYVRELLGVAERIDSEDRKLRKTFDGVEK